MAEKDVKQAAGTIGVPTTPTTPRPRKPWIVILWDKVVSIFTGKKN